MDRSVQFDNQWDDNNPEFSNDGFKSKLNPEPSDLSPREYLSSFAQLNDFEKLKPEYKKLFLGQTEGNKFINKDKWNVIPQVAPEAVQIRSGESLPLKDAYVEQAVDFLGSLYLLDSKVRNRFCSELKSQLSGNDIYYHNFKNLVASNQFRDAHQLLFNIPDLLRLVDNPRFQVFLGNSLVRAQLADQYNSDYKAQRRKAILQITQNKVQFMNNSAADGLIGDDPTSLVIMDNLFKEGVLVIKSDGGPKTGKNADSLPDDRIEKVREIFLSDGFVDKMLEYARIDANAKNKRDGQSPVRAQHKYSIQAKGGKLVTHQVGSYSLFKKLEHEHERSDSMIRPPFKSNFFPDGLAQELGIQSIEDILGNKTNQLDVRTCQRIQLVMQELAEGLIAQIANSGQTIVMRENAAEVIDYQGRGLGFYTHKTNSTDTDYRTGIVGFVDSMSVRDRGRAA